MSCRGSGIVEATKTVELAIPGGWSEIFMLLFIFNLVLIPNMSVLL